MVNELKDARTKRCRGIILEILKANKTQSIHQVDPVDLVVIQGILKMFGITKLWGELVEQIEVLERKGYVRAEKIAISGVESVLINIREDGLKVFDGDGDPDILFSH